MNFEFEASLEISQFLTLGPDGDLIGCGLSSAKDEAEP
jgi:hypothetical protein